MHYPRVIPGRAAGASPESMTTNRSLCNDIIQVIPVWIVALDQIDFPIAPPFL
jgi:hypothetical protein